MSRVDTWLESLSANPGWASYVTEAWKRFDAAGLASPHFERELTKGDFNVSFHRIWEMMVGIHLLECGLHVTAPRRDGHPDFLCEGNGSAFWVEATCATPGQDRDLAPDAERLSSGGSVPLDNILLRWTAAISSKQQAGQRYRENGVIGLGHGYVIAVNGALVGTANYGFGVSRLPYAVEATMGVGPLQITYDRETLAYKGSSHQPRAAVSSLRTGSPIRTAVFLDGQDAVTSAVAGFGLHRPNARLLELLVAHNPHATVPVALGALGRCSREWTAHLASKDSSSTFWEINEAPRDDFNSV